MARLHPPRSRASTRQPGTAWRVALALVLGGALSTAAAQQTVAGARGDFDGPGDSQGTEWGAGLGVLAKQEAYKGIKRETMAVPLLRFENEYVEFGGLELEVKLPSLALGDGGRIRFGLVGEADLNGYEAKDAPILAGMAQRKGALWLGAKAEWENAFVNLTTAWSADVSGHSKGRRFSLGVEKEWQLGEHLLVVPYVTAHWLDKKYVDYYYGVRAAEATAERSAYVGRGGVNVDIGLRTMYRFDDHHSALLDVGITRLARHIKASPLVGRSRTSELILGYVYSF